MIFLWAFVRFTIFVPILDPFLTLFGPFLAFDYIWGQISIDCHMRIYKLCKYAKNCSHEWYFYGYFMVLPFFTYFGPFLDPFLAFSYIWSQIHIDCHICIYKLCKHAKNCTHKWYFYGHF